MLSKIEIIISGHGGQGVILAGQILGRAAFLSGKNVLQTQTYGAEARRSLARSEVIISNDKIDFPAVRACNILVTMNQESLEKHLEHLKEDGTLIVNYGNVQIIPQTKAKIFKIPATETAEKEFGKNIYANMIMLGFMVKSLDLFEIDDVLKFFDEKNEQERLCKDAILLGFTHKI